MARKVDKHVVKPTLKGISDEQMEGLRSYLSVNIDDAFSSRKPLEAVWREALRMYDGVPKLAVRNTPIENAPNVEVTIGAIAFRKNNITLTPKGRYYWVVIMRTLFSVTADHRDKRAVLDAGGEQKFEFSGKA